MFTAVPCLVANLDEMSVDDVVTMETQIVSRSRDLRADEQKQISETLEKALHPLGHDVKLVVVEHRTSVGVYFICLSPEGLLQLRCLWRRGHLKNTIETVFTLLSGTTRPIIIKSFVWSSDNYQACVTYFGNTAGMNNCVVLFIVPSMFCSERQQINTRSSAVADRPRDASCH